MRNVIRLRPGLLAALATVAAASVATARAGGPNGHNPDWPYLIRRWTTADGLPQNKVQCVHQSQDGYIWAGTQYGAARFDGVRFTVPGASQALEAPLPAIAAMADDRTDGSLWIASNEGLFHLKDHRLTRYTTADGLPSRYIWKLLPRADGELWFESETVMARFKDGKFTRVTQADGLPETRPRWLVESPDGQLWLGKSLWRRRWDPQARKFVELPLPGLPNDLPISTIQFGRDGRLYVGTEHGLYAGKEGQWTYYGQTEGLGDAWIHFVLEDSTGQLWVGTRESGLHRLDGGRFVPVPLGVSESEWAVDQMCEDREGNLWIATREGLIRLQRRPIKTYTSTDGLVDDHTSCVGEGPDGTVWVGSSRGLSWLREGVFDHYRHPFPPTQSEVHSVAVDASGVVWAGIHGLWRFSDGKPADDTYTLHWATRLVQSVYCDRQGCVWIGTDRGVIRLKDGQQHLYTVADGLGSNGGDAFLQDREGNLWIGNNAGLHRLRDGKFTRFTMRDGLPYNRVHAIYEDAAGRVWAGTENGLALFRDGRFRSFRTAQGLPENLVNQILEDDFGYLWLSGLKGIHCVRQEELLAVAEGRQAQARFETYGEADGMLSSETVGDKAPAGCRARDGRLWFPTIKGVVVLDPRSIRHNAVLPPVVIEQVEADGEVIFGDGVLEKATQTLQSAGSAGSPARSNTEQPESRSHAQAARPALRLAPGRARLLEFRYTANSLVAPEKIRFRYWLHGHDQGWREPDANERVAVYTDLSEGQYDFQVIACNNHGLWNGVGAHFAFSVAPHFYVTWPFYALTSASFLLAAFALHHQRVRGLRRIQRLERQRAVEQERTRIARDLHDDLGASLTGVTLQLEAAQRHGRAEGEQLAALAHETRSLAHELRELAWTTNPRCDNSGSLAAFLGECAERFCQAAGLQCELDLPTDNDSRTVPARLRHELLVVLKESLTNVAKHAGARSVTVGLTMKNGAAQLMIRDEGRGFDATRVLGGNGLRNLRERLQQLGGSFVVESQKGRGTTVTARVPIANGRDS